MINPEMFKGYADMIILKFLEEEDDYGYKINQKIAESTKGQFKFTEATLYTTFKRLLQNEWITFYHGEGKNNVSRKYYSITALGRKQLKKETESYITIKKVLDIFFKEEKNEE